MKTVILFISSFLLYCAGMFYSIVVAANYTPGKMEVEGANESNEPVYWINEADYPNEADYHPLVELTESELESLPSAEEAGIDPKDPILPQDMIGIIATDQRGVEIQLAHGGSSNHRHRGNGNYRHSHRGNGNYRHSHRGHGNHRHRGNGNHRHRGHGNYRHRGHGNYRHHHRGHDGSIHRKKHYGNRYSYPPNFHFPVYNNNICRFGLRFCYINIVAPVNTPCHCVGINYGIPYKFYGRISTF